MKRDVQALIDTGDPQTKRLGRELLPCIRELFCLWARYRDGTQSQRGSRFVETILTVIETCRQQSRAVFGYLTTAVEASHAAKPAPSLLPGA